MSSLMDRLKAKKAAQDSTPGQSAGASPVQDTPPTPPPSPPVPTLGINPPDAPPEPTPAKRGPGRPRKNPPPDPVAADMAADRPLPPYPATLHVEWATAHGKVSITDTFREGEKVADVFARLGVPT
jgi:hypothetical protein